MVQSNRNGADAMDGLARSRPPAESFSQRIGTELGTDPETLLQQYREQVDRAHKAALAVAKQKARMAQLASRFGGKGNQGGHWEFERKAKYSEIAEARRLDLLGLSKEEMRQAIGTDRLTESYLDSYAHSTEEYRRFLERARVEMEQYQEADAKLSELFADLAHEKGILAYLEARVQTLRSLSYAWGSEIRNTG